MKKVKSREEIFLSASPNQTLQLARRFAKTIKPGTVLALIGNLGSGKTTFIKGIALGLGLKDVSEVKSPTFVLMHIYPTPIPLYHFDLYRLESLKEIRDIGFEEFANDPKAVTCVEWGEKAKGLLPARARSIFFEMTGEHERVIRLERGEK